ncbi:MAG: ABC transporter permease [Christensenellales bacterium]|jgi:ABC-type nitrate/sulfonate/bicarbonate transport system permease component
MKKNLRFHLLSISALLLFLALWYLATDVLNLTNRLILPGPVEVFRAFVKKLTNKNPDNATLAQHTVSSLFLVLSGYGLGVSVGLPLGILMGWNKWIDRFVRPLFDLLRPIPPVGWLPLVLILFGIGVQGKVFIIFFATLMPCVLNAYSGIRQVSETHLLVAKAFGATRNQQLFRVAIPSALPMLFTGLRVSLSTSWATLVAAEMLAAQKGLGYMIQTNRMLANADYILVGMISIGIIGALFSALLGFAEKALSKGR